MINYKAKFKKTPDGRNIVYACTDCDSCDSASGICNVCGGSVEMLHLSNDCTLGYEDGRNQCKRGYLNNQEEYLHWHKIGSKHLWELQSANSARRNKEMSEFLAERFA